MKELREKAFAFCGRDPVYYQNFCAVLDRPGTQVLWAGADGLLVHEKESGAWMAAAETDQAAREVAGNIPDGADLFTVQGEALLPVLRGRFSLTGMQRCVQAVYPSHTAPPSLYRTAIRPVRLEEADFVARHYHAMDDADYVFRRIEQGRMLGVEIGGTLAGFIGWHEEGAIGLLEVLPAYRRRGLAYELEAAAIAESLRRGEIPFAHIVTDNRASLALQKKLGMIWRERDFYWLF